MNHASRSIRTLVGLALFASLAAVLSACVSGSTPAPARPGPSAGRVAPLSSPPESTLFATAFTERAQSAGSSSVGDLWPSCWSDDDNLYAANGDGPGFGSVNRDIAMSRVSGMPGGLTGIEIAAGDALGSLWSTGGGYSRKPTGMACVDGALYLAVQDLNLDFNDAPNASISRSVDHGVTWTWDRSGPMFGGGKFTTIMFLDYGKNSVNAPDGYVYAYGLDNNWRDSFNDRVPDPVDLFLARVPKGSIQNRAAWQFFSGFDAGGNPTWSSSIAAKASVLHDDRRVYATLYSANVHNLSVLSQGGVVYNKPLNRYLYTSWTEYTFEFYEAPAPWGPWRHFYTKDFGGYPWTTTKHGGYGTTIPSKFISADGKTMWVQSNVCSCGGGGTSVYNYSLRKLFVEPYASSAASNARGVFNLAVSGDGVRQIERVAHYGNVAYLNDRQKAQSEDDWNDESKAASWWGYTWKRRYNLDKVVYTTGTMFGDGGWFSSGLRVQVRQNFNWVDVTGLSVSPPYPYSSAAGTNRTYTLSFNATSGDGVRIIGVPGGTRTFTSVGELEAYYGGEGVADGGFEGQATSTVSPPWRGEGGGGKGIDRGLGFAHSGANNAWIRTTSGWNAVKQVVSVMPNTNYRLTGWVRNSNNFICCQPQTGGYFGVRAGSDVTTSPLAETSFGGLPSYTQLTVDFNPGSNGSVTVFAGYWAPGADSWVQIDDVSLVPR